MRDAGNGHGSLIVAKVFTNPAISAVHAANFSREIHAARTLGELKEAATRHGDFLMGSDKSRLRGEYITKFDAFKGHKP